MSKEAVNKIITKMISDDKFREGIINKTEITLKDTDYDLSDDEFQGFVNLKKADFDKVLSEDIDVDGTKMAKEINVVGSITYTDR